MQEIKGRALCPPSCLILEIALLLPSQLFKKQANRLNPAVKVRDVKLLVGGVQVVVGETEAHHDAGNLQHILKIGDDRNRSAGADEHRVFLEDVMHGIGGGLDIAVVGRHY